MTWSSSPSTSRNNPWTVTNVFIAACCAVYVVTVIQSGNIAEPLTSHRFLNPASHHVELLGGEGLGWFLLFDAGSVTAFGQWWRILTAALVHLNPAHLIFNMILIYLLGRELERAYGGVVMLSLMVASASGGALACMLFAPSTPVGGASTVGYGMFAMILGLARSRHEDLRAPIALILVNLGYSMFGNVSLWGHVGGLVAGGILAVAISRSRTKVGAGLVASDMTSTTTEKTTAIVIAAVIFGIAAWMGLGGHYPPGGLLATSSPWS